MVHFTHIIKTHQNQKAGLIIDSVDSKSLAVRSVLFSKNNTHILRVDVQNFYP